MQNFMIAIGAGPLTSELLMEVMYSISMLICFVSVYSICEGGLNVTGVHESFTFPYATLSRKVGGALGCTRGYIITLIFLSIINLHLLKGGAPGGEFISGSFFAKLFQSATVKLDEMITSRKAEDYNKIFEDRNLYNSTKVMEQLKGSMTNPNNPADPEGSPTATPAPSQ